jgi:tRNA-specific 2-thiouridylase
MVCVDPRWCAVEPDGEFGCQVQIRAHGEPMPARAGVHEGRLHVELEEPAQGVSPGQAAVLYNGTRVIGSATIGTTASPADRVAASTIG